MHLMQSMLVTVSEQCDQKIMALREDERQEMKDLKNEKQALLERISGMREEQISLQMQIEKVIQSYWVGGPIKPWTVTHSLQ